MIGWVTGGIREGMRGFQKLIIPCTSVSRKDMRCSSLHLCGGVFQAISASLVWS